jgi:hypothetical protein
LEELAEGLGTRAKVTPFARHVILAEGVDLRKSP